MSEGDRPAFESGTSSTLNQGTGAAEALDAAVGPGTEPSDAEPSEAELIARLREQFGSLPAAAVVADTAMSLAPVAYVRLGIPPEDHAKYADLGEARMLIDAIAGLVAAVEGRLGPYERELHGVVAQLRLAYAGVARTAPGGPAAAPPVGETAGPAGQPSPPAAEPAPPPVVPRPPGTRPSGLWVPGQD